MESLKELSLSFLALVVIGLICIGLQKISPSVAGQKAWRKDSKLDATYWLFSSLLTTYVTAFFAVLIIALVATFFHPSLLTKINAPDKLEVDILQVVIAIILLDFLAYWVHRVFHTSRLWGYHSIHHSSKEIDWLSSVRFHPIESVAIIVFIYSSSIILGLGFKEVAAALVVRNLYGYFVHANLTWHFGIFGYVFASPFFHRWHHAKDKEAMDKNFAGMFSIWDFVFGTAYYPKGKQATNLGIHDDIGDSFWQHFKHPFRPKKPKTVKSSA